MENRLELNVLGQFSSDRNRVYLAELNNGKKVVYKEFLQSQDAIKESEVLARMSITGYAPRVIEQGEGYLINEYVEGEIVHDKFKQYTMMDDVEGLEELAKEMAVFLQIFYSMNDGYILDYINFNNFIIKDNRCYAIGFGRICEGMQYTDIAGIIAYAARNAVGGATAAYPFIRRFLKDFHLEMFDIINEVRAHFERDLDEGEILDVDELLNVLIHLDDDSVDYVHIK